MLTLTDSIDGLRNWISYVGRINRQTYWVYYLLPAFICLALATVIPFAGLAAFALIVIGTVKRFHDLNIGKVGLSGAVGVWVAVMVIAVLAAIVPFLGGISGSGNQGMIDAAAMTVAIPMFAILLLPLIGGIKAGAPGENKHGPPPAPFNSTGVVPVVALLGLVIIGSGAVQIARHVATREPELIVAVDARDVALTRQLLERGTDPNQTSRRGQFALSMSLNYPVNHSIAAMLLAHGANANVPHGTGGDMLLQEAVRTQDAEAVDMLLAHGADPNHPDNLAALNLAVQLGDVNIVKALLAKGANPEYRSDGRTPREWLEAYAEDSGVRITYDEMIALFE
jgi:uncharacterized membrane protein YhaH (DUF805 family)